MLLTVLLVLQRLHLPHADLEHAGGQLLVTTQMSGTLLSGHLKVVLLSLALLQQQQQQQLVKWVLYSVSPTGLKAVLSTRLYGVALCCMLQRANSFWKVTELQNVCRQHS